MKKRGFTLLELLVVVGILAMAFGLAIASFNRFNRRQRLQQTGLNFKSVLRFAQTRAVSAEKPSSGCTTFVGLHITFTDKTYAIQHECSEGYVGTIETTTLPTGITFAFLPTAFTFGVLTRMTTLPADQTVLLTNSSDETYAIQIAANGEVNDLGFQL